MDHGSLHVLLVALAASGVGCMMVLLWLLVSASWLLAHELALGAWAKSWLLALPIALGLLAHRCAVWSWSGTSSSALGWSAHSLALGAVSSFT